MDGKEHRYAIVMTWTGNRGTGTSGYTEYDRAHDIASGNKPAIAGSSDRSFRGDDRRWNPEELLVASLSACHQLAYLHLCAVNNVVVTSYVDRAEGIMVTDATGAGRFTRVTLRPEVRVRADSDVETALRLHDDAHRMCFIASSVNFVVAHEATIA